MTVDCDTVSYDADDDEVQEVEALTLVAELPSKMFPLYCCYMTVLSTRTLSLLLSSSSAAVDDV